MLHAGYKLVACQLQFTLCWLICGHENGPPVYSFPFPVGVIVNLVSRGQWRHVAGGGCVLPLLRCVRWLRGCWNRSTGRPRAHSVRGCIRKGGPCDLGGFSSTHFPSTPLLQCRWLLQDLARVGYSGQQHPVASSCSQKPLEQFYGRVHPAPLGTAFPWHPNSHGLTSSTCVASQ